MQSVRSEPPHPIPLPAGEREEQAARESIAESEQRASGLRLPLPSGERDGVPAIQYFSRMQNC
jgi:hypothetical protein